MSYLLDSNILTALSKKHSDQYTHVRQAISKIRSEKESIFLIPQNLVEFWSVATRPLDVNGLNLTTQNAALEIRLFRATFNFIDDRPNLFDEWENLFQKYQVKGKNVHDARIVAAMLQHGIAKLLTFNVKDFKRFNEISVVDPRFV